MWKRKTDILRPEPASPLNNKPINTVFESHSLCGIQRSFWKTEILRTFASYLDESSFKKWHLCLYKFVTIKPFIFIRWKAIDEALAFFNQLPSMTLEGIETLQRELSHAILSLLRPSASWSKEDKLSLDRPEQMTEFEGIWHPEYQRYCEHVFNHLIQLPLYVIGTTKRTNYLEQTLANRVYLLQANGLADITTGYDSVLRNAISHGSTSFELNDLKYIDKRNNRFLSSTEFATLFDSLVDTCHSILVALLLFLCEKQDLVESSGINKLPLGLRFIFIDAFSAHSGFNLLSAIESDTIDSRKQLNIVCRINSKARWIQIFEGMHTCWNASNFGGEDYNRFSVSFDCRMPMFPSLFLNGNELQRSIKSNEVFDKCAPKIIENALLWYDASILEKKMYSWKCIMPVWWRIAREEFAKKRRDLGLKTLSSCYKILDTFNRSTETIHRVEAHVILLERGHVTDNLLEDVMRHAIKKIQRRRVRKTDLSGEVGCACKPDYILVRLFAQEQRTRTLMSYGWVDKELVLIAEWINPSKKKIRPFYTQEADAVWGSVRIKYNPNLVQKTKSENTQTLPN